MPDPRIIPTMTTNTAPSGVASASSEYTEAYQAWQALDNDTATFWHSTGTGPPWWVQYQFASPCLISAYSVNNSAGNYIQSEFNLQGSKDGSAWTLLDSQTGLSLSYNTTYTYTLAALAHYTYFRLTITNAGTYTALSEFGLYGVEMQLPACYVHSRRNRLDRAGVSTVNSLA